MPRSTATSWIWRAVKCAVLQTICQSISGNNDAVSVGSPVTAVICGFAKCMRLSANVRSVFHVRNTSWETIIEKQCIIVFLTGVILLDVNFYLSFRYGHLKDKRFNNLAFRLMWHLMCFSSHILEFAFYRLVRNSGSHLMVRISSVRTLYPPGIEGTIKCIWIYVKKKKSAITFIIILSLHVVCYCNL